MPWASARKRHFLGPQQYWEWKTARSPGRAYHPRWPRGSPQSERSKRSQTRAREIVLRHFFLTDDLFGNSVPRLPRGLALVLFQISVDDLKSKGDKTDGENRRSNQAKQIDVHGC